MKKCDVFPEVFRLTSEFSIEERYCAVCTDEKKRVCLVYEYDGGYAYPSVCEEHINEAFRRYKLECKAQGG